MDSSVVPNGGRDACRRVILFVTAVFILTSSIEASLGVWRPAARATVAADVGSSAGRLAGVRLDPNVAPWWELTELPRVGESLAREVVAHRSAAIAHHGRAYPTADSLLEVRGIGAATLDRLRPYLRFDAPVASPTSKPNP